MYKKKGMAVLLFCFAIFLAICLATFSPYDQSLFYYNSQGTVSHNFFGTIGAHIAALLFYFFGVSSCLIVIFFVYLAYILFYTVPLGLEFERAIAFLFLPFISAAVLSIHSFDFFPMVSPGGVVGNGLKFMAVGSFDMLGAVLFFYVLLVVSMMLIFRNSTVYLFKGGAFLCALVTSKQRFLLPVYRTTKKACHIVSLPCISLFRFCKNLFYGEDIIGSDKSIVDFEQYILDQEDPNRMDDLNLAYDLQTSDIGFAKEVSKQKTIWKKEDDSTDQKIGKEITYNLPGPDLFIYADSKKREDNKTNELERRATILEEKLERFGVFGKVVSIKRGPVITLFEYQPEADSKISKILALGDDLALALQALSIRIIAPIPGRSVVGFEVANKKRSDVLFSSIIKSKAFNNFSGSIPLVLGKDTVGNNVVVDLAKMPHLLIAGSTGSGKSVALNSLLVSMLCHLTPEQLNLVLIDPKRLEFTSYEEIAHLLFPIITDPKKVSPVLKWVVEHMEERYKKMAQVGARNIFDYNKKSVEQMSFIVIVVDELADLMMTAGKDIEGLIARIAQMARAAGIHMIIATQRPSVDVITGLIKVNFPSRISFRVTSKVDSRTILDCSGAEKLLGRGDMLFLGSGSSTLKRLHGSYVSSLEIERVVEHIRAERKPTYHDLTEYIKVEDASLSEADDKLYRDILQFLESVDEVSISLLQRKFRIGYNRSARIIEMLESQGLILPSEGGKTRKVIR